MKKQKPQQMWGCRGHDGLIFVVYRTRKHARANVLLGESVVRVEVKVIQKK